MVSLRPSDASQGGGFPKGRLEITGAEFIIHDWGTGVTINGSGKSVAANLTLTSHEETDDEGKPLVFVNRVYSIGDPSRWVISGDGAKIEGDGQISKNCQFYRLVNALVESGFPEEKLSDNIRDSLLGVVAQWDMTPTPTGKEILLPVAIYEYDSGSKPTASPAPSEVDLTAAGVQMCKDLIASDEDSTRANLQVKAFAHPDDEVRLPLMNLVMEASFVEALGREGIQLDGETFVNA